MSSTHNPGRVAGFLYLLFCVAGPVRIIYIPSKLFVHGNATATANNLAVLMVFLGGVMPAAIYFFNVLNCVAALTLARGADFLSVFEKPQRDALAMLFLHLHGRGFVAGEIFYGLWLFPLGFLTYRSRFLPRFLGVWLIINGFTYLVLSFMGLLLPQYESRVSDIAFPVLTGEVAFMLWLLIKGAIPKPVLAPGCSSAGG